MKILFFASHPELPIGYSKIGNILSNHMAKNHIVYYFAISNFKQNNIERYIHPNIILLDALEMEKAKNSDELYGVNVICDVINDIQPDLVFLYNDIIVINRIFNSMIINKIKINFKIWSYLDLVYEYEKMDLIYNTNKFSDKIFVFSDCWKNNLIKIGISSDKIFVLNHGFDSDTFFYIDPVISKQKFGFSPNDFIVLNTNRNSYRKGIDKTIGAFIIFLKRKNNNPNIKLFLNMDTYGSYDIMNLIKVSCIKYDMDYNIVVNNHIFINPNKKYSDEMINYLYNACDVGINTCFGSKLHKPNPSAIGSSAGNTSQSYGAIAIGINTGQITQSSNSIAIGNSAGQTSQFINAIAIGNSAGFTQQGSDTVAIGENSGQSNQGSNSIAIGSSAGETAQNPSAVAIGYNAGNTSQGSYSVAVGMYTGTSNQSSNAVAIGYNSGQNSQNANAVAIGYSAGNSNQGGAATAIGNSAGEYNQSISAIAIGYSAGNSNQDTYAIAIGANAGKISQGSNAIAIGANAGTSNQFQNSIILNALSSDLSSSNLGFFVAPIRSNGASNNLLCYDASTKEIINTGKTFVIDHPMDKNKLLVHACLEGPEAGVYYRGEGTIVNSEKVIITLPEYVDKLANDFTINITAICDNNCVKIEKYGTSRVINGKFTVYGKNGSFYWTVFGKRSTIKVEVNKSDVSIKGFGPYTYLQSNE
jgi:glycosyltransferase involved in cell wall biosynthesis